MKKKYRISFTTEEVREAVERKKLEPKKEIIITRRKKNVKTEFAHGHSLDYGVVDEGLHIPKSQLVSSAWQEFNDVKLERNKLSSQTWKMVADGATTAELKEHYIKIESYRMRLTQLFDEARYVEEHGDLPAKEKEDTGQSADLKSLKYEKKTVSEKRSKLRKKIELGQARNSTKVSEWQLELEQADAEYKILEEKIAKLEGR